MDNKSIKKLEADLWEAADLLRQGSKLTSQQYCMPVLGLLFLRYAYSRFKKVEEEILKDRPVRNGRVMPVEASDFAEKSALYLPKEAQYSYLVNLPEDIKAANIVAENGQQMNSLGEVVNWLRLSLNSWPAFFRKNIPILLMICWQSYCVSLTIMLLMMWAAM